MGTPPGVHCYFHDPNRISKQFATQDCEKPHEASILLNSVIRCRLSAYRQWETPTSAAVDLAAAAEESA